MQQTIMKLYDMELSGNCYKIRLFCALLGLDYQSVAVNLAAGEHKQPAFMLLNPRCQIPVLEDDGVLVQDSTAILAYLARKYGEPHWLPLAADELANVMLWLAVAQNELLYGLARARAVKKFSRPWNFEECQALGKTGLTIMENHLHNHSWLANDQLSIADIACYPYVALAAQCEINLGDYPGILQWMERIQNLPGYVGMPGI